MDNSFLNTTLGKLLTRRYKQPEPSQEAEVLQTDEDSYDFEDTAFDKASEYLETHSPDEVGGDAFFNKIDQETKEWVEKLTGEE